jgi:hypothetical protein
MSTRYEIPLINQSQTFKVVLMGVSYQMTVHWCSASNSWMLDVADANGNLIIGSIPLVTGADLLAPYVYMNFGGTLTCSTDNNADAIPTYANLGSQSHLYFTTP